LLSAAILGVPTMTSARTDGLPNLLEALLAHPKLAAYFHLDQRPARQPIQVVNASGVDLPAPEAARAQVACVLVARGAEPEPGRAALYVDRVSVEAGQTRVEFRFPVEGLAGSATAAADPQRGWVITELRLVER
jgi:hypothetical protein